MTTPASRGRERLAEWKALHVGTPTGSRFCWCGLVAPCPTALVAEALDEATDLLYEQEYDYAADAILAKLAEPTK